MVNEALIEGCIAGDPKAQYALYRSLHTTMLSICTRYERNRQDAVAVMNLGFLKILCSLEKRPAHVPFEPWARRIVINTVIDAFRRGRPRREREVLDAPMDEHVAVEVNEYLGEMEAEAFAHLLEKLPRMTRQVFNLFAIDGYSHAEVAELLGISTGTSKWHVNHARGILKGAIARQTAGRTDQNLSPMKRPQAFDDLVRQKLDERAFPFDEAHWSAMQRLIASEKRRRRALGVRWSAAALLLLLVGGFGWFLSADRSGVLAEAPGGTTSVAQGERAATVVGTDRSAPVQNDIPPSPSGLAPSNDRASAAAVGIVTDGPEPGPLSTTAEKPREMPVPAGMTSTAGGEVIVPGTGLHTLTPPESRTAVPEPTTTGEPSGGFVLQAAATPSDGIPAEQPPATVTRTDQDPSSPPPTTTPPDAAATVTPVTEPDGTPTHVDGGQNIATAQSPDANAIAPPAPPAPIQPIDPTHLELSLLGGMMRTHTDYSGMSSENWQGSISDAFSPSFGVELMRMRKHTGWGFGLHYTSYKEQLNLDEQFGTNSELYYTHTFTQVDTTVLNVVDTIMVDGVIYYVTEQVNTTIWVLDTDIDTNITTVVTREPVDRINRVSYVEVPVLFDVHAGCGRWQFGIRAGATLGLLTTRQGAVPSGPGGSLMTFEDQQFRSTSFGYVARPYLRYATTGAWAFGIEPCLRGQLVEDDISEDLSRRSSGLGVMASLVYRLR